jgi:hypothetical protein
MNRCFLDSTAFVKLFVQEPGTQALIDRLESMEDNAKLISAITPIEVAAAILKRERAGDIRPEDGEMARASLRHESTRIIQQPLNPAVLEASLRLLEQHDLRPQEAIQLASAIVARDMLHGASVSFLSTNPRLLHAARQLNFETADPAVA